MEEKDNLAVVPNMAAGGGEVVVDELEAEPGDLEVVVV